MAKMAYLRHFTGFLALLVLLTGINGDFTEKQLKNAPEGIREAIANQSTRPQAPTQSKKSSTKLKKSPTSRQIYAKKLETLGIDIRPGTEHRKDSKATPSASTRCRSLVYQTLVKLPKNHRNQLQELTLYYTKDGRRGLGGSGSVVLRCLNVTDSELVSVLVHEIGHLVDSGALAGTYASAKENFSGFYDFDTPVPLDDPSSEFYSIAWKSERRMKDDVSEIDFVSLYAMTDPFEDFAETYTYFRLHGKEFRMLMQASGLLQKKYEFMRDQVFNGREFYWEAPAGAQITDLDLWTRDYDVTVLPFSLKNFLG